MKWQISLWGYAEGLNSIHWVGGIKCDCRWKGGWRGCCGRWAAGRQRLVMRTGGIGHMCCKRCIGGNGGRGVQVVLARRIINIAWISVNRGRERRTVCEADSGISWDKPGCCERTIWWEGRWHWNEVATMISLFNIKVGANSYGFLNGSYPDQ